MLYEDYGKYGYESKYVLGDINVMCSMQEHLGVLLELKGRGCRQMESYLLAQERSWYDTVYQKYYDDVLILLKTGLRISELCGLTVQDLDFENHTLNINHQLLRNQEGYYIETPKTKCGIRKVPMSEEAGKAFQRVLKRKKTGKGIVIDGYRNFLFLNQKGMPMTACYYTSTLRNIVKKYNKYHDEPLPKITPHILRHTFCTRLAQKNMNPKNLQYIMGHSSIMITLNLYAHASQTGANMEMRSLIA